MKLRDQIVRTIADNLLKHSALNDNDGIVDPVVFGYQMGFSMSEMVLVDRAAALLIKERTAEHWDLGRIRVTV